MKAWSSPQFLSQYRKAPLAVQKAMRKQMDLLVVNIRHPSLHAKKYDESRGIWQGRVTKGWRFYFSIRGDTYELHEIKTHPK